MQMWRESYVRAAMIESTVHLVNDHMHSDLTQMVERHTQLSGVISTCVLWTAWGRSTERHPLLIRWAIAPVVHMTCSDSIQLPSPHTRRNYTHHFQAKVRFSEEVEVWVILTYMMVKNGRGMWFSSLNTSMNIHVRVPAAYTASLFLIPLSSFLSCQ